MNTSLFRLINNFAGRSSLLDKLGVFCAEYLMYVMVLVVLYFVFKNYRRWRDMAIVSLGSAVVARFVVAEIIKRLYNHPRPYWILTNVHLLLAKETESSFPSGHTIFVFALATGVYLYHKTLGKWLLAAAALVGIARVYAGVHWPYDIIFGAILGILTALVCDKFFKKYKHKFGL